MSRRFVFAIVLAVLVAVATAGPRQLKSRLGDGPTKVTCTVNGRNVDVDTTTKYERFVAVRSDLTVSDAPNGFVQVGVDILADDSDAYFTLRSKANPDNFCVVEASEEVHNEQPYAEIVLRNGLVCKLVLTSKKNGVANYLITTHEGHEEDCENNGHGCVPTSLGAKQADDNAPDGTFTVNGNVVTVDTTTTYPRFSSYGVDLKVENAANGFVRVSASIWDSDGDAFFTLRSKANPDNYCLIDAGSNPYASSEGELSPNVFVQHGLACNIVLAGKPNNVPNYVITTRVDSSKNCEWDATGCIPTSLGAKKAEDKNPEGSFTFNGKDVTVDTTTKFPRFTPYGVDLKVENAANGFIRVSASIWDSDGDAFFALRSKANPDNYCLVDAGSDPFDSTEGEFSPSIVIQHGLVCELVEASKVNDNPSYLIKTRVDSSQDCEWDATGCIPKSLGAKQADEDAPDGTFTVNGNDVTFETDSPSSRFSSYGVDLKVENVANGFIRVSASIQDSDGDAFFTLRSKANPDNYCLIDAGTDPTQTSGVVPNVFIQHGLACKIVLAGKPNGVPNYLITTRVDSSKNCEWSGTGCVPKSSSA